MLVEEASALGSIVCEEDDREASAVYATRSVQKPQRNTGVGIVRIS
jgi:hypothetical protein